MYDDARIECAFRSLIASVDVPEVPQANIAARVCASRAARRRSLPYVGLGAAAAAAVLALTVFPSNSAAVMQTIEMRFREALYALGGQAPPAPSDAFLSAMKPAAAASIATARARVDFTLQPPAGLPRDSVVERIELTPSGVFSRDSKVWRNGSPAVTFACRRSDGRTFDLLADRYDAREGLPGKYMFEALGTTPSGKPIIVRHEHFAWRNGSQVMSATVGSGINAREIDAIRAAMHGVALPRRELHAPGTPERQKISVLKKP